MSNFPTVHFDPIGIIHSPWTTLKDMPIQMAGARGIKGSIELDATFVDGLKDVDGFSHLYLLYVFHASQGYSLTVTPFLDNKEHGVFATRAPKRPNPIGLSIVRLVEIEENTLFIQDVDILDGTPLLDIKPVVPAFDHVEDIRVGWLTGKTSRISGVRSDQRFE